MSFVKSFLVSLISLAILNLVFYIIFYAIGFGTEFLFSGLVANPVFVLDVLFSPTAHAMWVIVESFGISLGSDPIILGSFLLNLGYILAPLIAAVITGRLSEKRVQAFTGFFVSIIICMLVGIFFISQYILNRYAIGGSLDQTVALMNVILGSFVNGLIYGVVAYLTTKK